MDLPDFQPRHTEFQIRQFIVGRDPSLYGQYEQVMREIHARLDILEGAEDAELLAEMEIERLERAWCLTKRARFRKEIALKSKRRALCRMRSDHAEARREMAVLQDMYADLKSRIGNLTPERRDELDRERWLYKTLMMMAMDLVCAGGITRNTYEMLIGLPRDMRAEALSYLRPEKKGRLHQWAASGCPGHPDEIETEGAHELPA